MIKFDYLGCKGSISPSASNSSSFKINNLETRYLGRSSLLRQLFLQRLRSAILPGGPVGQLQRLKGQVGQVNGEQEDIYSVLKIW